MNKDKIDQIASAVLYEGYLLYPYRPSVKNRQRWTFGGIYPKSYSDRQSGTEPWFSQTECLIQGTSASSLTVRARFLQLQVRQVEPARSHQLDERTDSSPSTWQEAVEREVTFAPEMVLAAPIDELQLCSFSFPYRSEQEVMRGPQGEPQGTIIRQQEAVAGSIEVSAEQLAGDLFKITVRVQNETLFDESDGCDRDDALLRSLVSTHTILGVRGGAFVSSIDPPERFRQFAAACKNLQSFPVMVGDPGDTDAMLAAPIILYDYPEVAPESPGDLFDSTEIDEILTLRILTLTDEEKQAMAAVDDRARVLLERTESLANEQLIGMHGTIRGLRYLRGSQ
jgi:hypothetical protein